MLCEACHAVIDEPEPILPLCEDCRLGIGIDPRTSEYLSKLVSRSDDEMERQERRFPRLVVSRT